MEPSRLSYRIARAFAALATIGTAACNSITGADSLVLYADNAPHDGEGGAAGSDDADTGAGSAPGTGTGSSGQGAGHPDGQTTTSSTTTSSTTTSSTTTTTSTSTTTTSGGLVDCTYPDGPFGVYEGNYVQGNLAWQGYAEGAAQSGDVSIQDYFDCDGSKGVNALLIINSASWCGACQEEATDLPSHAATFAAKGIRILTLMVENAQGAPASLSTATSWRDYFGLDAYATVADPNFSFAGGGSVGLPLQILVDPRTMKIVDRSEGFGGWSAVTQLADQNAN